jgi:hypothetical protein
MGSVIISPVSVLLSSAAGHRAWIVVAKHAMELVVPQHVDLLVGEQPLLENLLGAEHAAAMHEQHLIGDVGEVDRFFDRSVAATDHDHVLPAIKEAIAGRASRDAVTLEALLGRKPEPARLCAGGDDQGVGCVLGMAIPFEPERAPLEIDLDDMIVDDFGADMFGLHAHLVHEPWTLNHLGEARIVFYVGGDGHLAAGLDALDQKRLQHGARGVDSCGVAGRT